MPITYDQLLDQRTEYFYGAQRAFQYESVWSFYDCEDLDDYILASDVPDGEERVDVPVTIKYTFYAEGATVDELLDDTAETVTVSAIAKNGTVRELWAAAESCWLQAKDFGDWHKFIEDFEEQEDGSIELVMGS